jgi:hypothetical protein
MPVSPAKKYLTNSEKDNVNEKKKKINFRAKFKKLLQKLYP